MSKVKLKKTLFSEKSPEIEDGIVSPDAPACPELIMFIKKQIFKGQMVRERINIYGTVRTMKPSKPRN